MTYELADYQLLAKKWVLEHDSCALFMGMGMGKTLTVLDVMNELFHDGASSGVLVVAPLRVALLTWPHEIKQWFPWMKICNLRDPKQLQAVLDGDRFHFYLINYEALMSRDVRRNGESQHYSGVIEKLLWENQDWPFDTVVFDELTRLKSHSSASLRTLKPFLGQFDRIIGLTGTPTPNGYLDLWAQLYVLDQGATLRNTFYAYRNRWFEVSYSGFSYTLCAGAKKEIDELVSHTCLTLRASDYLDIPDTTFIDVEVPLPAKARKDYKTMEKELLVLLQEGSNAIVALNGAVLASKLLQMTGGYVYDEERNIHCVHDARIARLITLVSSIDEPVLIASCFRHEKDAIIAAIPGCVRWEDSMLDDWKAGKIKAIVADPRSIGHGLNLQDGGSTVIWFTRNWSRETYDQFNDRVCGVRALRSGRKPTVYHLTTPDTIDDAISEALRGKGDEQAGLLKALTSLQEMRR